MAGAYLDLADGLWPDGDEPIPLTDVLSCAPGTPVDELPGDRRLAVCEALADFADLKSVGGAPTRTGSPTWPARLPPLGPPPAEQDRLRRAGLVHDLGKIAVPYRLLERAGDDTGLQAATGPSSSLAEPVRLHPYYAQRILSQVRPLADLAADVGAYHERLDGSGYPLGLGGPGTHRRKGARRRRRLGRASRDRPPRPHRRRRPRPGMPSRAPVPRPARYQSPAPGPAQISAARPQLPRARSTAAAHQRHLRPWHKQGPAHQPAHRQHHVEHILAKLGVTSRTAAVAYAITHELL